MTTFIILQLVDKKLTSFSVKLSKWYSQFLNADKVSIMQMGKMTSGITSYTDNPDFTGAATANPYRLWTAA